MCIRDSPRSLLPFDYETVEASVKKTGKLMIVHEDTYTGGWGAQVAAHFAEHKIFDLDAPVKIVAAYDTPIPCASPMENFVIPSTERITEAARELARF